MEIRMTWKKSVLRALPVMAVAAMLLAYPCVASARDKADKVKSVFLFKFFDYVTWPGGYIPGTSGEAVLCTYGSHEFGDMLEYIAQRKNKDFRFRVRQVGAADGSSGCHILYIAAGRAPPDLPPGSGILTVGDAEGFLQSGGVIRMKEDDGKVKIMIDLKNAEKSGLKISSRLLDIAEVSK